MKEKGEYEWTTEDWTVKLKQQARDSEEYRHRLYDRVGLSSKERVLDVGCGTGIITRDLAELSAGEVIGIDLDEAKLEEARRSLGEVDGLSFQVADAQSLPFDDGAFDLVVFNIVLVYVPDKQRALNEMARVTRPGGHVLASLEPDYAGELCYPEDPSRPLMRRDLEAIGADLETGRKLKHLFTTAGLDTEVGMDTESDFVYQKDDGRRHDMFVEQFWVLEKSFQRAGWTDEEIEAYRREHGERIRAGLAFSFMPSFYAIGTKR
jgi:SAM-dependent methyltransferase